MKGEKGGEGRNESAFLVTIFLLFPTPVTCDLICDDTVVCFHPA